MTGTRPAAVDRLPAETMAQIVADHPSSNVTGLFLLVVPALLVLATRRASVVSGERWGVRSAWLGAAVLWFSMLLNFGLLADPDSLPAVTLVTSGFDEPVPPIALLPAEPVLGIALLVGSRR